MAAYQHYIWPMLRMLTILFFGLVFFSHIYSQGFEANLELGFNASQIDGDQFAGYSKVGLHSGLAIEYVFNDDWRLGSGIFYDALGSQKEIQVGSSAPEEQQKTQLSYISVPIMMIYGVPSSSERGFSLRGGLQMSYLFDSKRPDFIDDAVLQYFKKVDITVAIGADYHLSSIWSIGLKASESITLLFNNNKVSEINANSLRNRFLTISLKRNL